MRRAATRFIVGIAVRGLKPTATITMSRRDKVPGSPGESNPANDVYKDQGFNPRTLGEAARP